MNADIRIVKTVVLLVIVIVLVGACRSQQERTSMQSDQHIAETFAKALFAQQQFREEAGKELEDQYQKVEKQYPLVARYIALQEVTQSLAAVITSERFKLGGICEIRKMVTPDGTEMWLTVCPLPDLIFPTRELNPECILRCMHCITAPTYLECYCNCPGMTGLIEPEEN